jgi:hypothetical protein
MISAVAVSAQVWVGVQASVMNVGLSSPSIPDLQLGNDIGYSLGGLVEVEIAKDVRLSLQPAYSNFGTMVQTRRVEEIDGAKTDVYVDTLDLSFSYLSVPLLMKVANSSGVVHAIAGIQPNLRIASRSDDQFTGETADLTDKTRSVTLDMIFGLGVNLSLWSQPIVIDLRYVQGLTEIPTPETVNNTTIPDGMRMSGFQLCVSWLLPIVGGEAGGAK